MNSMEAMTYISPIMLIVSVVVSAIAIGKVKAAEAWKDVAQARKEEIDVRDNKLNVLGTRLEEKTAENAVLTAEAEKLRAQPNLTILLEHLKEFRMMDEKRYETILNAMNAHVETLNRELDRRFLAFAEKIHEYHTAELAALHEIAREKQAS